MHSGTCFTDHLCATTTFKVTIFELFTFIPTTLWHLLLKTTCVQRLPFFLVPWVVFIGRFDCSMPCVLVNNSHFLQVESNTVSLHAHMYIFTHTVHLRLYVFKHPVYIWIQSSVYSQYLQFIQFLASLYLANSFENLVHLVPTHGLGRECVGLYCASLLLWILGWHRGPTEFQTIVEMKIGISDWPSSLYAVCIAPGISTLIDLILISLSTFWTLLSFSFVCNPVYLWIIPSACRKILYL